jgi:hypothetical protein
MWLTMAGNVYSFGVILLELLTGKPAVSEGTELAKWALGLSARPGQREQVLDTRVSRTSAADVVRPEYSSLLCCTFSRYSAKDAQCLEDAFQCEVNQSFFCPHNLDMFLSGVGSFSLFVDVSTPTIPANSYTVPSSYIIIRLTN